MTEAFRNRINLELTVNGEAVECSEIQAWDQSGLLLLLLL